MENESTTVPLHHPDAFEMTSFIVQGLIVSVAISVFLETLARDYVAPSSLSSPPNRGVHEDLPAA
jgi:hypothetical protein